MNWTGGARYRNSREANAREKQKAFFSNKRKHAALLSSGTASQSSSGEAPASSSLDLMYLNMASNLSGEGKPKVKCRTAHGVGVRHVNLDTPHCKDTVFPRTVHLGSSPEATPSKLSLACEIPESLPAEEALYTSPTSFHSKRSSMAMLPPETKEDVFLLNTRSRTPAVDWCVPNTKSFCSGSDREHMDEISWHPPPGKKPFFTAPEQKPDLRATPLTHWEEHDTSVKPVKNYLFEKMIGSGCRNWNDRHDASSPNQVSNRNHRLSSLLERSGNSAGEGYEESSKAPTALLQGSGHNSQWHDFIAGSEEILPPQLKRSYSNHPEHNQQQTAVGELLKHSPVVQQAVPVDTEFVQVLGREAVRAQEALDEVFDACPDENAESLAEACHSQSTCSSEQSYQDSSYSDLSLLQDDRQETTGIEGKGQEEHGLQRTRIRGTDERSVEKEATPVMEEVQSPPKAESEHSSIVSASSFKRLDELSSPKGDTDEKEMPEKRKEISPRPEEPTVDSTPPAQQMEAGSTSSEHGLELSDTCLFEQPEQKRPATTANLNEHGVLNRRRGDEDSPTSQVNMPDRTMVNACKCSPAPGECLTSEQRPHCEESRKSVEDCTPSFTKETPSECCHDRKDDGDDISCGPSQDCSGSAGRLDTPVQSPVQPSSPSDMKTPVSRNTGSCLNGVHAETSASGGSSLSEVNTCHVSISSGVVSEENCGPHLSIGTPESLGTGRGGGISQMSTPESGRELVLNLAKHTPDTGENMEHASRDTPSSCANSTHSNSDCSATDSPTGKCRRCQKLLCEVQDLQKTISEQETIIKHLQVLKQCTIRCDRIPVPNLL